LRWEKDSKIFAEDALGRIGRLLVVGVGGDVDEFTKSKRLVKVIDV
jgi:hypothetical protein